MFIENIPGYGSLRIDNLILDLNGTLSIDGIIIKGVEKRLAQVKELIGNIFLFTGDTNGNAIEIAKKLGLSVRITKTAKEKAIEANKIGADTTVAIGNGLIDSELFEIVRLSVATLQAEGVHMKTLQNADIVVPSINDALDILIKSKRLIATLRF